jgi:hypothetical protein
MNSMSRDTAEFMDKIFRTRPGDLSVGDLLQLATMVRSGDLIHIDALDATALKHGLRLIPAPPLRTAEAFPVDYRVAPLLERTHPSPRATRGDL